ncbi:receptor-type tyrosine-protein phosphatase C isoform X2 [Hyperolius riggenbachi]|uniref:receptor-type tyrosine-protein phosphatase C isoform X2 n=1 Tax=Hyperolius riggenbachi TaxID=752182 RepID=UPI0035A2991D
MNSCIPLLVIGFLLWDQNHFISGQTAAPTTVKDAAISSTTQASTVFASMDRTSPPNSTEGTSSTDFHQSTSPASVPTMTVSPPSGGESEREKSSCSSIKFKEPSYEKQERLIVENISNHSLSCEPFPSDKSDFNFSIAGYNFPISYCETKTINCSITDCRNPITLLLNTPPDAENCSLSHKTTNDFASFTWNIAASCNASLVKVITICTYNETEKKEGGKEVLDLKSYTNYSCDSILFYGQKRITSKSVDITTKVGKPGKVEDVKLSATSTTITVTWKAPQQPWNGPLSGFSVSCKPEKTCGKYITGHNPALHKYDYKEEKPVLTHTCEGLCPFTSYIITVKAYNKDGEDNIYGNYKIYNNRTNSAKPTIVQKVHTSLKRHNEFSINCEEPEYIYGSPGEYVLQISTLERQYKDTSCDFNVPNLSYLTTYSYKLFYKNQQGDYGEIKEGTFTTRYNDKALIGFLAFLIILTSLALIVVLFKIYKLQNKSLSNNEDLIPLNYQDDEKLLLNIEPILVDQLLDAYKKKNADEGRLFLDEFQSIPRVFSKFSIKEARKPCNQPKNRYIDILPYDDNRVVLSEIHGETGSDYINASYINGFKEPRKYIAAQGPKEETMNDFWRMIWEQKSTIIVMVTRCEEGNRNKCAQYWPSEDEESVEYGDIMVKCTEEKFFPDYITRKLHISHKREKAERDVTHIQFTVWPDHGVPDDPNLLLKLRRRVNAFNNFFSGPIIVHCSAGVGRTGTYISIDAMLEGLEAEGRVDVYGYVVQLRRQRCLMVQVESQYIFIHKSLVEYNQFGETEISMAELALTLNNMKKIDPPNEPSQLKCEFQRLPSYRNWRPQTAGNHQDNKDKNQNSSVIPYEFNRVLIKLEDEPEQEQTEDSEMSSDEDSDYEESSYINASYIIGYWGNREVIAAQSPLKNTLPDFWRMIFQKKVKVIVMLNTSSSQESAEDSCAPYWKEKSKTYDDLEVELASEKSHGSFTERCFQIRHPKWKDVNKVSQFHYEKWDKTLPTDTNELLDMIEKIKKAISSKKIGEHQRHDRSVPLLVHCSDGAQLTGTFCALWHLLESAQVEGVIDVFQIVKNLRRQRPGIVSSFEQYEFLYDTLASKAPAQNGEIKAPTKQEVKVEIQKVLENKETPDSTRISIEETPSKPKDDDDTTANGTSDAAFTEVTLRIDE